MMPLLAYYTLMRLKQRKLFGRKNLLLGVIKLNCFRILAKQPSLRPRADKGVCLGVRGFILENWPKVVNLSFSYCAETHAAEAAAYAAEYARTRGQNNNP
jgi:hypothetical protein